MEGLDDVASYPAGMDLVITIVCRSCGIVDVLRLPGIAEAPEVCKRVDGQGTGQAEEHPRVGTAGYTARGRRGSGPHRVDRPLSGHPCESSPAPGSRRGRTRASLARRITMDAMLASCLATELRQSGSYQALWCQSLLGSGSLTTLEGTRRQWPEDGHLNHPKAASVGDRPAVSVRIRLKLKESLQYFRLEPDIRW